MEVHPKLKQHARLLAALITAAVLLSICAPASDASPGMGRQTPVDDGDIEDYPFYVDPDSGSDEVAYSLEGAPPQGWPQGGESGQDLLNPDQAATQTTTAAVC